MEEEKISAQKILDEFNKKLNGKVVTVSKIDDSDVGEGAKIVSIFLKVFNVHVNRVPLDGEVKSTERRSG